MSEIQVSVILPTRNRAALLANALSELARQTMPQSEYEVIVVDNGSTDETRNVAAHASGSIRNFKYVYEGRPGLHEGRHAGLRAASGAILLYGDDDIRPLQTWVEAVNDSFSAERVWLVGGKCIPDCEGDPPGWFDTLWNEAEGGRSIGAYSVLDFGDQAREISPLYIWGCNFAVRRDVLIRLKGFHPDAMPESLLMYRGDGETGLSLKVAAAGGVAWYEPSASVLHRVSTSRMTPDYIYRRGFAQGISDSYSAVRYRRSVFARQFVSKARAFIAEAKARGAAEDAAAPIRALAARGHAAGFDFHQRELKTHDALRAWVLRESYIDTAP